MTIAQLVQTFADISVAQGEAIESCRTTKANRLAMRMFAVRDDLASHPDDRNAALANLFAHPNAWVRYNAANALLDVMPLRARPVIQAIVDSRDFPLAGHAGMTLSLFDGELSDFSPRRSQK